MIDRDARHLRRGVDAGVGAPRRHQRIVRTDDGRDFVFEHGLNAEPVGLPLPPRVG